MTSQQLKGIVIALMMLGISACIIPNEPHTNLKNEHLNELYLYNALDVEPLQLAKDVTHPGYAVYDVAGVVVTTAKEPPHTLYRISTSSPEVQTEKELTIGSTKKAIIEAYGDTYIRQRSDQADYIICYMDREHDTKLSFYMLDDRVEHISMEVIDFYQ